LKTGFDGTYFKHQKGENTISLIAGISKNDHAFIQIITNRDSYYIKYPLSDHVLGREIKIGDNSFSEAGVKINIAEETISLYGEIKYNKLTPLRYDIMGPFKYLPMQCRHKISSLHHKLSGSLILNGETIDFTEGTGYIEGDSGTSFPKNYVWIQCNDFREKACITASVADVPFMGTNFRGCICVVYLNNIEYRLATYLGVKILAYSEKQIILKQGNLLLEIEIDENANTEAGYKLMAPEKGEMKREIRERIMCGAGFKFMKDGKVLLARHSGKASFEYVI